MIQMKDLIPMVARSVNVVEKDVDVVVRSLFKVIEACVLEGEEVSITDFGRFASEFKPPRPITSYLTDGKEVQTHGRVFVKFYQFKARREYLWDNTVLPEVFDKEK